MGQIAGIHHAASAVRRAAVLACCAVWASAASAQIIQDQPMPAQSVGAVDRPAAMPGTSMTSRSASGGGSDIDRYRELTEIGGNTRPGADAREALEQAHLHYCRAARNGSTDALVRLGWMYLNGLGVRQDDATAGSLFRLAKSYGSQLAGQLGLMVNSYDERMPDCLGNRVLAHVEVEPAQPIGRGATTLDSPARFSSVPPTIERQRIAGMVVRIAAEFRLDPRLVMALVATESNFDPTARSPKNAFGLMQLIPETAARFQVADPLDPAQNLRGGMAYLSWLLSYFRGDVILALAAYNAGEGAVDRYKGVPPYPETMAYVQRIRALYPHDRHSFDSRLARASPLIGSAPQTAGLAPAASALD